MQIADNVMDNKFFMYTHNVIDKIKEMPDIRKKENREDRAIRIEFSLAKHRIVDEERKMCPSVYFSATKHFSSF